MLRAPGVVMIFPRIGAGTNGDKAVAAFFVGEGASFTGEVRVERRVVLVVFVKIPASCVGLPDFDEGVADRPAVFIENSAADGDEFAEWLALVLAGQIERCG